MGQPLEGRLVVEAGMNVAGPMTATVLGDLGAEVVKIEPPAGDPVRRFPPHVDGTSALFAAVNRNKRLLGLDLRHPDGRGVLTRLLERADVVVQNLRPGKAAGLGLDALSCHDINPRIVHCSIEAFHAGEESRPGYDLLVQAESGIMALTGPADGAPARLPGTMVDQVTGLWTAHVALAHLAGPRDRVAVTTTLMDVATWMLLERSAAYLATGIESHRMGSSTSITTPHGVFPTADGHLVIGAPSDAMYAILARTLGPPLDDPRFADQAGRLANRVELEDAIGKVLSIAPTAHWRTVLDDVGVPNAEVRGLGANLEEHARDSVGGQRLLDGRAGLSQLAPPVVDDAPWELRTLPGGIGRDSRAVLADLGMDETTVTRLVNDGVIVQED